MSHYCRADSSRHSYVLVAAAFSFLVGSAHSVNTGKYRKAAKVVYPAAYAPSSRTDPEAHKFNCAQRAHANYIENQVQFVPALLISGLRFPVVSAALGTVWVLSRIQYSK